MQLETRVVLLADPLKHGQGIVTGFGVTGMILVRWEDDAVGGYHAQELDYADNWWPTARIDRPALSDTLLERLAIESTNIHRPSAPPA